MATATSAYITWGNTTDAEFRTWVAEFITQMLAVGWVQTSDTGQINTSTVAKPTGTSIVMGYAMFKPSDGLADYYLKCEFCAGGHGQLQAAVRFTLGWETDGAGLLTGMRNSDTFLYVGYNGNAIFKTRMRFCKVGGAASWNFSQAIATNGSNCGIAIDRYRDADGTALTTGVTIVLLSKDTMNANNITAGAALVTWIEALASSGGRAGSFGGNRLPYAAPSTVDRWSKATRTAYGLITPWDGGPLPPMLSMVVASLNEAQSGNQNPRGSLHRVNMYGTDHFYAATMLRADSGVFGYACLLWE